MPEPPQKKGGTVYLQKKAAKDFSYAKNKKGERRPGPDRLGEGGGGERRGESPEPTWRPQESVLKT